MHVGCMEVLCSSCCWHCCSWGLRLHAHTAVVDGEQIWPGYYSLDPHASVPSCETDIDVDKRVQREIAEKEDDPFGISGGDAPNEEAIRRSIESNLERCKERHEKFESMQERITPF